MRFGGCGASKRAFMFDEQFEAVLADTAQAREIHYRIRFHVYCLKRGMRIRWRIQMVSNRISGTSVPRISGRRRDDGEWIGAAWLVLGKKQPPRIRLHRSDRFGRRSSAADRRGVAAHRRTLSAPYAEQKVPYETRRRRPWPSSANLASRWKTPRAATAPE